MGAWKKLNQQDVFITTYNAKKSWTISGSVDNYTNAGIDVYLAESSSNLEYYLNSSDLYNSEYKPLVYRSINQLYYRGYDNITGSLQASSSYDHYYQSYKTQESRHLGDSATILTIPRNKFGAYIEPKTFLVGDANLYTNEYYSKLGYTDDYITSTNPYFVEEYITSSATYIQEVVQGLRDDGEGNIYTVENGELNQSNKVGNIFYTHGIIVITETASYGPAKMIVNEAQHDIHFRSNHTIYTHNYNIKLADYEFNYTQNPSAITGSDNSLRDNITGSYFQPYITTVGLYNDANELIAVAKLGQPLPKTRHTDTTIQIKLDI